MCVPLLTNHRQDFTAVDLRLPENFYHDVNSVAGVLKQFFRELPQPLLWTNEPRAFLKAGCWLTNNSYTRLGKALTIFS